MLVIVSVAACSDKDSGLVELSNGIISLGFERETGKLVSFESVKDNCELIDSASVISLPWRLGTLDTAKTPAKVVFKRRNNKCLVIEWHYPAFEACVKVRLDKDRPMSYWKASVKGLSSLDANSLSCPVVDGMKHYEKEVLLEPSWMGALISDPASLAKEDKPAVFTTAFPHSSAQVTALYDSEIRKNGLYISSRDVSSSVRSFVYEMDSLHTCFRLKSLIPDAGSRDEYEIPFESVVGCFDGDWLDAAKIYKQWASSQKFCVESRLRSGKSPEWLRETAFWVWNRGRSFNVLEEAEDIRGRLGLPVNVYWHWWHNCAYDSGFPEYIPPREGRESFVSAVEKAHGQGIHSLIYMNSYKWGDSTESWKAEGAEAYAAQKQNGDLYSQMFEIFSRKTLTAMCMGTEFWRDKYASLCDTVLNRYHVDGVYMDEACENRACYNPDHGHTLGGGTYWVESFRTLTDRIRASVKGDTPVILSGEGSAEDWIPMLDLFLTLQASRERYKGVNSWEPVPLFQAIYHEYAVTFGNYSSLVYPPYDEKWVDEFRPANAEKLLPEEFNTQFRMEQARSFVWGMQPTLANYHSFLFDERKSEMDYLVDLVKTRYNALDYLLYGTLKALPDLNPSMQTIPISRVSIYAGRYGSTVTRLEKTVPVLYSALWLSGSGNAALAISNISDRAEEICFVADASKFGLPSAGNVNIITSGGKETLGTYRDGDTVRYTVPSCSSCVIEFEKL